MRKFLLRSIAATLKHAPVITRGAVFMILILFFFFFFFFFFLEQVAGSYVPV
jgi:hypothetical protein